MATMVWPAPHQCTMQDGWYVNKKQIFNVFMYHGVSLGTKHLHVSTYLVPTKCLNYLPTYLPTYIVTTYII
jgi:hypothetical protein